MDGTTCIKALGIKANIQGCTIRIQVAILYMLASQAESRGFESRFPLQISKQPSPAQSENPFLAREKRKQIVRARLKKSIDSPLLWGYFWGYITPCQESIPPCPSQIPQYAAQSPQTSRKSSLTATASFSMSRQAAPKAGA